MNKNILIIKNIEKNNEENYLRYKYVVKKKFIIDKIIMKKKRIFNIKGS